MKRILITAALLLTGCTSNATRQAIQTYHQSEGQEDIAFNNTLRTAKEQMFLSLAEQLQSTTDKRVEMQSIQEAWTAREQLEECRVQHVLARCLGVSTVGLYLDNQQGWLEVLLGDKFSDLNSVSNAVDAGDKAAGISSPADLIPTTGTTASKTATTKPAAAGLPSLQALIQEMESRK